jgi:hypothetical protein
LLLGAALSLALAAAPARAEPMSAAYQVYFGGLNVLKAEALWEQGATGYRLTAEAETQGFVGWLNPWKGTTESQGQIFGGKVIPERHLNWGSSDDSESDGERLVMLSYDAEGNITETLVQPEQDWEGRHPLPADADKGTLDPLSVIAGLAELLQAGGRCEGSFAVFDGRKRYNLIVSDAGEAVLPPTSYSIYAGPARGCRLDYEMLGGHRIERSKYVETAPGDRDRLRHRHGPPDRLHQRPAEPSQAGRQRAGGVAAARRMVRDARSRGLLTMRIPEIT